MKKIKWILILLVICSVFGFGSETKEDIFIEEVEANNIQRVKELSKTIDVNFITGDNKITPIWYSNTPEMIETLINLGANLDKKDYYYGNTLLMASINSLSKEGKNYDWMYPKIITLIDNGAKLNVTNDNNETALMIASKRNLKEVVDCLLENGAKTNIRDKYGESAIILAAQNDSKETFKRLKKARGLRDAILLDADSYITLNAVYGTIFPGLE